MAMSKLGANPIVQATVEGTVTRALLDSGCLLGNVVDTSYLLSEVYAHNRRNMEDRMQPLDNKPCSVEGTSIPSAIGMIELKVTLQHDTKTQVVSAMFYVMNAAIPIIIGWPTLRSAQVLPFYISVLYACCEEAQSGPNLIQLAAYMEYKPIYNQLRHMNPTAITTYLRERHVFGSHQCEVVAQHEELGVKVNKSFKKNDLICSYTYDDPLKDPEAYNDVHYAIQIAGGRTFNRPDEGDLHLGPLVNDALSAHGNNVKAMKDHEHTGCVLRANRPIKAGELLGMAYGSAAWAKILVQLKQHMMPADYKSLRLRAEKYYEMPLMGHTDFLPTVGEDYSHLLPEQEEAPEEADWQPANGMPEDCLSLPAYEDEHVKRVQEYKDELKNRIGEELNAECPELMDYMLKDEVIDVFAPRSWTGVKHPDTGDTWVFIIEWLSAPRETKAKLARIRAAQVEPALKELDRMTLLGFFATHFGHIASTMLVAPKKTDPFIRLVAHYAWLTGYFALPKWPLKNVKDSLNFIVEGGFGYFFDLDLMNSFHQCKIDDVSSAYLSIVTPRGQLRPLFLPEGISPATAILQMMVDTVFASCGEFMLAIYDNLLVCGRTLTEACENFKKAMACAIKCNVKLKLKKCSFGVTEVTFFGYRVTPGKYFLEDQRILDAQKIPFPADDPRTTPKQKQKKMQAYLGVGNFFQPFLPGYAEMTAPLYDMTRTDFNWDESTWPENYREIFTKHKTYLMSAIAIHFPDYELDWFMEADASQYAIAVILYQQSLKGEKQPLALLSQKFSGAAFKWHIIDKECFAIYHGVKKLKHLLRGKHFTICTDACNMRWMKVSENPRVQRFLAEIISLPHSLRHIPGKLNIIADWFSRMHPEISPEQAEAAAMTIRGDLDVVDCWSVCSLLNEIHGPDTGHHGVHRTWTTLKKLYPESELTMKQVQSFVEDCPVCQKTRDGTTPSLPPIPKVLRSEHARNKVAFDLATITESKRGNKYVLVIYNMFTKHAKLVATKDKTARTTAVALFKYFSDFGTYDSCHSDPGSDYTSAELKDMLTGWLKMKRSFTLTDNPQADGVEPVIKQMMRHLRALCLDKSCQDDWDDEIVLAMVQLVLNETISTRTGVSPFEAQFGYFDSERFKFPAEVSDKVDSQWVRAVSKQLADIRAASAEYQEREHQKREPGANFVQARYQPTDYVLVLRDKWSKMDKLSAHGEGPYEVVEHPRGSNHVRVKSLITDQTHTFDCNILRAFVATKHEATRLARSDARQHELLRIEGHTGTPKTRTKMQFALKFADGDRIWKDWSKDVTNTLAYEEYCSKDRYLNLLLSSVKDAVQMERERENQVIPEALCNTDFLVDLRVFGDLWYQQRTMLPDHLCTTYLVHASYGVFADRLCKRIFYSVPSVGDINVEATSYFVYFHGYRTRAAEAEVLLTDEQVREYGVMN